MAKHSFLSTYYLRIFCIPQIPLLYDVIYKYCLNILLCNKVMKTKAAIQRQTRNPKWPAQYNPKLRGISRTNLDTFYFRNIIQGKKGQ